MIYYEEIETSNRPLHCIVCLSKNALKENLKMGKE
jgi:hypothetical protein